MSHTRNRRRGQNGFAEQAPAPFPYPGPHVSVQVLHAKNASVANVSLAKRTAAQYDPPEYEYKASGAAKREPKDVRDDAIGELLALARAFEDLSRQLMSEAGRRVRESVKAENERQAHLAEKRAKAAAPPVHRTLEEWQAHLAEKRAQAAKNAVMAGNLGLSAEQGPGDGGFNLATVARVPGRHEKAYVNCPEHGI